MRFKTVKLGGLLDVLTDYHANGAYKKLKENVELLDEPDYAVMIRTTNFEQNNFASNLKYITEHAYNFLAKSKVYAGDIIMNKIANAGSSYLMPELDKPVSLAMNLFLLRINTEKANPTYVYIYLKIHEAYVKNFANGSVTKTITKEAVKNLEIQLPERSVQDSIVKTYFSLSDKIQLNQQINQTLEQMAQAIFKNWFVDFEPVKAKIAALEAGGSENDALLAAMQVISGKDPQQLTQLQTENPEQYATLRATAELFPAAMQESELGEIPEGWFLPSFEELTTAKQGRYLSKDKMLAVANEEFKVPVWGGNGILGYAEKSAYSSPVVLMTCRGSNCGLIKYTESASWVSNNSFACTPCIGSSWFLLNYFQLSTFEDCISGSAQPQITHTALKTKQFKFPVQQQLCERYSEIINPIFDHILQLKREIITLKETRDTLLPKLLSGELSVNQDVD